MVDEFWKNDIFTDHGLPVCIIIPTVRREIFRQLQNKSFSCWDHFLSSDTRQESQIILCRRFIWHRVGTNDIYTGCHNHRSLLISLSVGGIPQAQGSGETVYTTSVVRPTLLFIYYFSSKYFPRVQSIRTRGDFGYEYQYSS
jgi:hypothetical protein